METDLPSAEASETYSALYAVLGSFMIFSGSNLDRQAPSEKAQRCFMLFPF